MRYKSKILEVIFGFRFLEQAIPKSFFQDRTIVYIYIHIYILGCINAFKNDTTLNAILKSFPIIVGEIICRFYIWGVVLK